MLKKQQHKAIIPPPFPSQLYEAPSVQWAYLVVPYPFLKALLMENMPTPFDAGKLDPFGEISQANGALPALHGLLVIEALEDAFEAIDRS
jgi:hypothetical protein